jgi:hypothetical protein
VARLHSVDGGGDQQSIMYQTRVCQALTGKRPIAVMENGAVGAIGRASLDGTGVNQPHHWRPCRRRGGCRGSVDEMGVGQVDSRAATIRAELGVTVENTPSQAKESSAHTVIWRAVALKMGMGVVPFGINIGSFFAVSTGVIIYVGELCGYTYTQHQAAALLKELSGAGAGVGAHTRLG